MRWSLLPLALAVLAGCTDSSSAPGAPEEPVDLATLELASCVPESAATATAVIGRDGGSISVGNHLLVVPRRSLDKNVSITMLITPDSAGGVTFLPEGLKFKKDKPAQLTLSYDGCSFGSLPALHDDDDEDDDNSGHGNHHAPETTGIVYLSSGAQILEYLPSSVDSTAQTVTAKLKHFSRYAVAW